MILWIKKCSLEITKSLFNTTPMQLSIPLISYPNKHQIISILRNHGRILSTLDFLNGGVNGLVVFQFDNDGVRIDVFARDEHQVGEAFACG